MNLVNAIGFIQYTLLWYKFSKSDNKILTYAIDHIDEFVNTFNLVLSYIQHMYLVTATALSVRFPAFRVKGAVYLKVTSRPPIFLWKGDGFDPSDVKYILQSGVSEKKNENSDFLIKHTKFLKPFIKKKREKILNTSCIEFFFQIICMLLCVVIGKLPLILML